MNPNPCRSRLLRRTAADARFLPDRRAFRHQGLDDRSAGELEDDVHVFNESYHATPRTRKSSPPWKIISSRRILSNAIIATIPGRTDQPSLARSTPSTITWHTCCARRESTRDSREARRTCVGRSSAPSASRQRLWNRFGGGPTISSPMTGIRAVPQRDIEHASEASC